MSLTGIRQLGEVAFDELVVTGMTLTGPPPQLPRALADYEPAANELEELGIDGAHSCPEALQVATLTPARFGALTFDELTFDHEPVMPATLLADGHGGCASATVRLYRAGAGVRPWVIWIHGAAQGDPMDLLIARVRQLGQLGFNVALPVQPGHGPRRRSWPEYPARDPLANVAGTMRAVSEVRALIGWLEPQASSITVAGFSLGSAVAALVSHLDDRVKAVAVYTPILGLNTMIGLHLGRWGVAGQQAGALLRSDVVTALTSVVDPLATVPRADRRLIVGSWHDRMAMRDSALALHARWGGELQWHDGGHVGHLLSPQIRDATNRFLAPLRTVL